MRLRWIAAGVWLAGVAGCPRTSDPGDLRTEARLILAASEDAETVLTLDEVLGPGPEALEVPPLIRVWRRGLDGSATSCEGRVDVLELEDYVEGVLPAEWMASWTEASLEAGAIAARTYGAFWVEAGGRYQCADVDDTTWTQVYTDRRHRRTSEAVQRTTGAVATRGQSLVYAEYSAENGHPTASGVEDHVCRNRRVQGHGRGMCQWGTERWGQRGKDAEWMVRHYYPGARVAFADEALVDGVPLQVTAGERFALSLKATNPGPEPWPAGAVSVRTDRSAFQEDSWLAEDTPAVHDQEVPPATTVTLTWWMRAPPVDAPAEHPEFFWLDGPVGERPGTSGSWHLTVLPAQAPEVEVQRRASGWPLLVVLLGALTTAGLALWWRRS